MPHRADSFECIDSELKILGDRDLKFNPLLLTAATFLVGCAAPYKAPTSGPTATISFEKPAGSMFGISQFNSLVSDEKCTNPVLLSTFSPIKTEPVEQVIRAGTRIYITADLGHSEMDGRWLKYLSCKQVVSFVPRQGEKYSFRQNLLTKSCSIDLISVADRKLPESAVVHPVKACDARQ